jgi:group I intron endonuclease
MSNVENVINSSMGIIYKTTNIKNGKIYIGKDKNNNPSYLGSGVILEQAIQKYGRSSFQKEIIEECDDTAVDSREIFWIAKFNSTNNKIGYNITNGGTGGDTTSNHPDKKTIISKRNNGLKKWHNSLTEDARVARGKKISASKKGKSNGHTGLKHREETKELIKNNQPAKTDEWRKSHATAMAKRKDKPFTKKYKPVIVNDVEYPSIKHAIESLGIKHRATFYDKVKRGIIKLDYK